jgi:hypothetical protein
VEVGGGFGAPEADGVTGSGGFDVGVAAGGLAAPARGATEEVAGVVGAAEAPALGSVGAAVVVAGVMAVGGIAAAVGGAVVAAEALPEDGVAAGMELVAGIEAVAPLSERPPTSGQRK